MLSGTFGKIKIAEIKVSDLLVRSENKPSAILQRYNKNVGLDFVNVRYDCPSFKTLEMDNDLVTLSIVDCISVVDRCGNLDKLIVQNATSNIKDNYLKQINPEKMDEEPVAEKEHNYFFNSELRKKQEKVDIRQTQSIMSESQKLREVQLQGQFGEVVESSIIDPNEYLEQEDKVEEMVRQVQKLDSKMNKETIVFYSEMAGTQDPSKVFSMICQMDN